MIWNHINWQGTIIQLDEMTWLLMWHELPRNAIIGLNMNERTNEQTNEWMDNTWYEYTVYGDACSQWATRACWCNSVPNNQTEATETLILWYLKSPTLILDGEQKSDLSNRYRTDPVAIGVVCSFLSSGRCCFLRQFLWFGCVWHGCLIWKDGQEGARNHWHLGRIQGLKENLRIEISTTRSTALRKYIWHGIIWHQRKQGESSYLC